MNYKVLARKWRPKNFNTLIGQEHILIPLKNSLKQNKLHHTYLFSGSHGIGKTSIARIFAKALNCKIGITDNPCCICTNCLAIDEGCFMDLIEIDAASNTKVEDMRDLIENLQYSPTSGNFKIYLIDEAHMLSRYSFNALLKTLEEPPKHIKFILATTESKKIPITILSRCLQFHLKKITMQEIVKQLKVILETENIPYDNEVCILIAQASHGSLRDALSITDKIIAFGEKKISYDLVNHILGNISDEIAISIIENIINNNIKNIFTILDNINLHDDDLENILIKMLSVIHTIAIIQIMPNYRSNISTHNNEKLHSLAKIITPINLQLYYRILLFGREKLLYSPNNRIGIEMTLIKIITTCISNNINKN